NGAAPGAGGAHTGHRPQRSAAWPEHSGLISRDLSSAAPLHFFLRRVTDIGLLPLRAPQADIPANWMASATQFEQAVRQSAGEFQTPGRWRRFSTRRSARTPNNAGVRSVVTLPRRRLFARVTGHLHILNLLHDLVQIVARRILQRREVDVGLKLLQPQRLAHRQEVPVILVSGDSSGERSAYPHESLDLLAN